MKFILSAEEDEPGIWYGRYLTYLETIKSALPRHIYEFASTEKHFTLNSPHSLHDSRLKSVEIEESRIEDEPVVGITIKLLGQAHDRFIFLKYERVIDYSICGSRKVAGGSPGFRYADTFHGDVFTHEVRVSKDGIIHEIAFATESSFLIECRNFTHREELLPAGTELSK